MDVLLANHAGTANLGPVFRRDDIRSSMGPFYTLPSYRVVYPPVVLQALGALYTEYNAAFDPLVQANRESATDYQYCVDADGGVTNFAAQIDMVGLSGEFFSAIAGKNSAEVVELLRGMIFEIENSLAMYGMLQGLFGGPGGASRFSRNFCTCLDHIRNRFDRPIALLAVTHQKHRALLSTEFGWQEGQPLPTDDEVRAISGFDCLMGPDEFRQHVDSNGGASRYLLYARTSDPLAKLKDPRVEIDHPLLGSTPLRQVIKASSLTLNIDAPDAEPQRRINDTKAYMPTLGMAYLVTHEHEVFSTEVLNFMRRSARPYGEFQGAGRLCPAFTTWLAQRGLDSEVVANGRRHLRAKPLQGTYGCYGHVKGALGERDFRARLRQGLERRGSYLIQPELPATTIINAADGRRYAFIDRVFLESTGGRPTFLGGFRDMIPLDSEEVARGRIHGNKDAVWAEIVD